VSRDELETTIRFGDDDRTVYVCTSSKRIHGMMTRYHWEPHLTWSTHDKVERTWFYKLPDGSIKIQRNKLPRKKRATKEQPTDRHNYEQSQSVETLKPATQPSGGQ